MPANNLLLVADKVIFPAVDLSWARSSVALMSISVLLFGLIWDTE